MAANRALVATSTPPGSVPVVVNTFGVPQLDLVYVVVASDGTVIKPATSGAAGVGLVLELTYGNMNNVTSAIQDAVKAAEGDPSLQVYVT